ncbi:MAG: glutamine amidotransferase [Acidobacteria bacterium]|nr:MAG: glutamine amidotransferase [Acidobacteriota bacterium]
MNIAILIYDGFTALDVIGPYEVLSCLPDAKVHFVSTERGPKRAHTNFLSVSADYTLDEVPNPDVIVVSGGTKGTMMAAENQRILNWIRNAHETSKWTTSVCTGSLILGAAGLLKGLRATTHWYAKDLLPKFGAQYSTERVIQQGKIITAAGVSSGIDMALHLAQQIAGSDMAKVIQLIIEYDPQPPYNSGSIEKAGPVIAEIAKQAADTAFS